MKHSHQQIIYVEKNIILQSFYFSFYSNIPNLQSISIQVHFHGILVYQVAGSEHRPCKIEISKELCR